MGYECVTRPRLYRCLHSGSLLRGVARRVQAQAQTGCALLGVGSSVPEQAISNDDLSKIVETNDEWIAQRTGIRKRHVLGSGESIVSHAAASCEKALEMAGVSREDVDMIIMATSSPEDLFGSATQARHLL